MMRIQVFNLSTLPVVTQYSGKSCWLQRNNNNKNKLSLFLSALLYLKLDSICKEIQSNRFITQSSIALQTDKSATRLYHVIFRHKSLITGLSKSLSKMCSHQSVKKKKSLLDPNPQIHNSYFVIQIQFASLPTQAWIYLF